MSDPVPLSPDDPATPPASLRIALCQTAQRVGDIAANRAIIDAARSRAAAAGADLAIFPELQLIGAPPEDLVLKPAFVMAAEAALVALAEETADGGPAILVGTVIEAGGLVFDCAALLDKGRIVAVRQKRELASGGASDDRRLFAPGPLADPIDVRGARVGIAIGDDIAFPFVTAHLRERGAEIVVAIAASPYEVGGTTRRLAGNGGARVAETGLPLIWVNRVGGQDELAFDGASFVLDADGAAVVRLAEWREDCVTTAWHRASDGRWRCETRTASETTDRLEGLYAAMTTGFRDHVRHTGAAGVVLPLDDSIGSALSAAVAIDAIGCDRVRGVGMGTAATDLAQALSIGIDAAPVIASEGALAEMTAGALAHHARDMTVAAIAERTGFARLGVADKTDLALGAGHGAGDLSVVGDAYRTTVIDLAAWRNARDAMPLIPPATVARHVAAHGQPPDSLLDPILYGLVDQDRSTEDLAAIGFNRSVVAGIEAQLIRAEAVRRRAAVPIKLGRRSFGRDRRYPVANAFHTGDTP